MAGKQLELTIKAIDQATRTLRDVRGEVSGLGNAAETAGEQTGVLNRIQGIAVSVAAAAGGAYAALRTGYQQIIAPTVAYAQEVDQLQSVLGGTTEETSRLIQVCSDFGIGQGELQMAMRALRDRGLSPTLETLGQLSEQYRALNPGADRMNFLVENFGKSGPEWTRIMEEGNVALAERNELVSEGLILSPQQIADAQQMALAVDDLNDAWEAAKTTVGVHVIPVLLGALQVITDTQPPVKDLRREIEALQRAEELAAYAGTEYADGMGIIGFRAQEALSPLGALTQAMIDEAIAAGDARDRTAEVARIIDALHDKHITVTVSMVEAAAQWAQQYVDTNPWNLRPTIAPSVTGHGGSHGELTGDAAGGPIGPITEVGEEGTEGIINGIVVPHNQWEALKRMGLVPEVHAYRTDPGSGRGYQVGTGGKGFTSNIRGGLTTGGKDLVSNILSGGGGASGGEAPATVAAIEEIKASTAQQAATLAATIPAAAAQAASEQSRALVEEIRRSNDETNGFLRQLVRAYEKQSRALPVYIRDAVERTL